MLWLVIVLGIAIVVALILAAVWSAIALFVEIADEQDAAADETDPNRIRDLV